MLCEKCGQDVVISNADEIRNHSRACRVPSDFYCRGCNLHVQLVNKDMVKRAAYLHAFHCRRLKGAPFGWCPWHGAEPLRGRNPKEARCMSCNDVLIQLVVEMKSEDIGHGRKKK